MKRILSILLTAVLLLSVFSISALAEEKKPEPTSGPAAGISMFGGARCGIYNPTTEKYKYAVSFDYGAGALKINNEEIPGMTYDKDSNTLTVKDVDQADNELFVWYMGNDFKLKVEGACAFGAIKVYNYYNFYSTTLNITGSGTLTVNEKKANDNAIQVFAMGSASVMGIDIADSVTVDLYSKDAAPVISVNASALTPDEGGAITGGGKALTGVKSEQIKDIRPDYVQTIEINDRDKDFSRGYQVTRKSDPEGVYVYNLMDNVIYSVSRYIYVDELELWVIDDSFSYVQYNKDEFEAEYDLVCGMAPAKIDYMSDYLYERRGTEGVKLLRDDEPDAVYVGVPTNAIWDWGDDHDYSGNYEIHRVLWDDDQEMYVEDTSFKEIDLVAAELEENGFQIEKETHDELKELKVWDSEPSYYNRNRISGDIMIRDEDPDGLYVCTGKYTTEVDGIVTEQGITVHLVHYDAENDDYYIKRVYSEPECFYITDDVFISGESGFSNVYDTISTYINLRYLPEDYDIQSDMSGNMIQLKKDSEPGAVYGYRTWTHYFEDDTEREEYGLYRLQFNEKLGVYVEDSSFDYVEFYDLSYLDERGYEVVESYQALEYYSKGRIYFNDYPIYHDNDDNTYYADYGNNVYSYSDANTVTIGETTYYAGTYEEDLGIGELNSTEHEVVTDKYKYWVDGPEYHHAAGEQPEPVDYALWVNGEQVTSDHLTVTCGTGTATYDPVENTLTLDNAEITKGTDTDWTYSGVLSQMDELTVVIKGNCTITETSGDGIGTYNSEMVQVGDVFYPAPYDLTVTGDGILTIKESTPMYGYGLYCTGNLVLDGVTLHIESAAAGVWASDLKMDNVTADIQTSSWYSGIVVNRGNFTFDNSTVSAKSGEGAGLLLGSDQTPSVLTVSSGTLNLEGKIGIQGIVDMSVVTVNGGKLSVEGSEKAFDDTFLADDAKNIVMGEGIGVTSGAIDGKAVVIEALSGSSNFTLSGTITSYLSNTDMITVQLQQDDSVKYSATATGNTASYSIEGAANGSYTLRVSKKDHVTREYTVNVTDDTTQDVKICPIGDCDLNGKVQAADAMKAYKHAQGKADEQLSGYAFDCADVAPVGNPNGKVQAADAMNIYQQAQGKHNLF